jgi:hypothetical protein
MDELEKSIDVAVTLSEDGTETEYRLTIGECSIYRKALFDRYRARIYGAAADEFAKNVELPEADKLSNEFLRYFAVRKLLNPFDAELIDTIVAVAIDHAIVLASVHETRKRDGETWVMAQMPAWWYEPMEAIQLIPPETIRALVGEVLKVTPVRVFGFIPADDEQKKRLKVIVAPSAS